MEFRLLGPLEAGEPGAPVALGSEKQRALLALLLLDANHAVSLSRLIEGLWGEAPPEKAVKAIQTYVSRLRKALPQGVLSTRPHGYAIEVDPDDLDLHVFERLLEEGRRGLAENRHAAAGEALRRALGLWRGLALAEFAAEPFAASEGARLEELRLLVLEERVEADLALGRHADLIGELELLVEQHPFRERFCLQLMLALYRSGREAEALGAYRDRRTHLVGELGIEPSRKLHELESAILRQDPVLDEPSRSMTETVPVSRPSIPFVGREVELARLAAALDEAFAGDGRLVMVSGEPGIGKSRLVTELAGLAQIRGARVLWGRCYEREGAPPYWPWVQAIRSYADQCDLRLLGSGLQRHTATVAEIVPELREQLPGLGAAPAPRDPKEARFLLLDSVASFLRHAAAKQVMTIILDNLHAADAGSLLMLEFLARELAGTPLLVVGTYRDVALRRGDRLVETLAELTREGTFERLPLRGLTVTEVARLVEAIMGRPAAPELMQAIHRQAEGNPLFVTEVVRVLDQEDAFADERSLSRDWSLRVPEGVRAVIGRRLDQLSPACNDVLRLASVIGREFGLRQLQALVVESADDELLGLVHEALDMRLVEELPDTIDCFRFTHRLIQETLLSELSTTQRVRLHARVAEALEQHYGDTVDAHAAELVHHCAEAETVLGPAALVRYARLAGEQALVAHSYEEASAYFRQALDAKAGLQMDEETASLLFGLARSEFAGRERYDLGEALGHMCEAFTYFETSGDRRRAIEVATHPVPYVYGSPDAAGLASRALTLVPAGSGEAGHLLTTLGWFTGMTDYDAARDAFGRSTAIARQLGDATLERRVLLSEAHVDFWHLEYDRCLEKGERAIALSRDAGDERTEMLALSEVIRMCATLGRPVEADRHALRMLELADRFRERYWLVTARVNRLWLCVLTGEWEAARALSEEALALQPRDARSLASRALVECQLGEHDLADAHADRLVEARWLSATGFAFEDACVAGYLPLLARIAGNDGRLDKAAEAAAHVDSSGVVLPLLDMYCGVGRALTAVREHDAARARAEHDALLHLRGTALALIGVTADRLLGLLSATAGDVETALSHFERGLDFCRRTGYRPECAWTASDYAEVLLGVPDADGTARAADLRAEALSIARELGMLPLADRLSSSSRGMSRRRTQSRAASQATTGQ